MAINAEAPKRELTPAGNHVARCFQMLEIGTVEENIQGKLKNLKKCVIGWEIPDELNSYGEPFTIMQEYTLSLSNKSNLRRMLASWRGKDFTDDQAMSFDITNLLGVPCMLNVIHTVSKKGSTYANVNTVATLPKSIACPPPITPLSVLQYDAWDDAVFEELPQFLREKIEKSEEYQAMTKMQSVMPDASGNIGGDGIASDLPF